MTRNEATLPTGGSPRRSSHAPWRGLVAPAVLAVLLCVFTLTAQTAKADSITFQDTTSDNIVSVTGSTRTTNVAGCGTAVEICSVTLAAPTGATFVSSSLSPILFIGEGNGNISDELLFAVSPDKTFVTLTFVSDFESPLGLGACPSSGCTSETGLSQVAGLIAWSNASTDSVNFASDVEPTSTVPEPASLILLGSGLTFAAAFLRRRRE